MKKISTLLIFTLLISAFSFAQVTITGNVKQTEGLDVTDVNIRLKGKIEYSSKTDDKGNFSISIPENSTRVLEFYLDGYDTKEIDVKDKTNINVVIIPSIRVNQYGIAVDRHEGTTEFHNGILVLESKDGKFKYWFDTRVYIDGAYFFDQNTYNKMGNGIIVRRARFALKAKLWENWYGEFDVDMAGAQMEVKDMYLKYTTDNRKTNIKIGNFKEGFSMESTTTSRYITFIERSLVNEFAPSRHIGINATNWGTHYTAIGGIHFQKVGEYEEVEITNTHNKQNSMDEGYSFTGRLVGRPIATNEFTIHVGANASYRTPKTSWEIPTGYRVSTKSLSKVNRKKYLDTDDVLGVTHRVIYGAEIAAFYKNIMFQAEYMMHDMYRSDEFQETNNVPATVHGDGYYAQVGYIVFGGQYQYNKAEAEPTQIKRGKDWGDIELAFRYDHLNLNDFDAQVTGGSADGYTFGINYHVNHNIKMMLNYTYLNHDRYANGKGKLYVGYDEFGELTKDPELVKSSMGTPGEDYGMIQVRFEVDF